MIQIIVAPDQVEVTTTDKGVVCVTIKETCSLELFLGSADTGLVNKIQHALYEERAKELGISD
ncbi:MAG: hypothetical protein HC840_25455, partial [Leptolyngbyaceae cyanobacterium RM2_2_4]|nr:hypothetical protein [Leptolyngbyaceae cyanobacterium RM2_2_4]